MAATTVMTFTTLDQAESALDWIGLDFGEAEGCFEGDILPEDVELLDEVIEDAEAPEPVRALAAALRDLLDANPGGASWAVAFEP
jgi:hypothetical protein